MKTIAQKVTEERKENGQKLLGQTTGTYSFRKGSNLHRELTRLGLTEDQVDVRTAARAGQNKNDGYQLLIFSKRATVNNTKARHIEILNAAKDVLAKNNVDITQPLDKNLLPLAKVVARRTRCHIDTAKRNVAKAARLARGEIVKQWGGKRN